jgi:DNA-binding MarR family transcriptional regulator
MTTIVRVTRTISASGKGVRAATAGHDQATTIIADFRSMMSQLKCASSERLLRLGVSMAQVHIMYTLQRTGEMTMSHLADVLNVSLSNATGLIDRMEERGFIERYRVPTDRRIVLVRLTPSGEALLGEVDALSDDLLRSVLGRLPTSQLRGVGQAMSALRAAVDSTVGPIPDRHLASTPAPRMGSTMRGQDLATHHGRD